MVPEAIGELGRIVIIADSVLCRDLAFHRIKVWIAALPKTVEIPRIGLSRFGNGYWLRINGSLDFALRRG